MCADPELLTKRESQIASLLALGFTKKEVAEKIFRSEETIINHTRKIYDKLGLRNVVELTIWWLSIKYKLSINVQELRKEMLASAMLLAILFSVINHEEYERSFRGRNSRRRTEYERLIN